MIYDPLRSLIGGALDLSLVPNSISLIYRVAECKVYPVVYCSILYMYCVEIWQVEAEKAAWRLSKELGVDLVTILPSAILGPPIRLIPGYSVNALKVRYVTTACHLSITTTSSKYLMYTPSVEATLRKLPIAHKCEWIYIALIPHCIALTLYCIFCLLLYSMDTSGLTCEVN